jgi:arylsulfatase A-like enzyme
LILTTIAVVFSIDPGQYGRCAESRNTPNIIFILADDLGWRDTTLYGSTFHQTPNIDRLAKRGMMFTQAYAANPLCSPTRASLMTGLWPARIGITSPVCHVPEELLYESLEPRAWSNVRALGARSATRLKLEYFTLAEALHEAGYATGHFGKWHLGPEPYDPLHQGFDVDVPHYSGPGPANSYLGPWKFPPTLQFQGQPGEHLEDRMAAEAVKFIRANRGRPFFLNYWAFSVHEPWGGKPSLVEKYRRRADPRNPQHNPVYAAMVESLDDAVGTLLATLDELGLGQRTVVVFFSDNGGVNWHEPRMKERDGLDCPPTSNLPLRGGKATIYEGGTREPCIVVWPGVTPCGARSAAIVQSVDFYPTLLEMAGLKPHPGQPLDGVSIVPALKGQPLPREAIFCHFPHYVQATGAVPSAYVRQGDWKLIRDFCDHDDQRDRFELYNLRDDLGEAHNLAETMPQKVAELNALLDSFLEHSGAVVPKPNPGYRRPPPGAGRAAEWAANADAAVFIKDRQLVITAIGRDPLVITIFAADAPAGKGPFRLDLRLKANSLRLGQVYWSATPAANFRRAASVSFPVTPDDRWHDYQVTLPVEQAVRALRLNNRSAPPGEIRIQSLRLKNAAGDLVKEWHFDGVPEGNYTPGPQNTSQPGQK